MKPTELAALLNVSPATLRRWAGSEYAEFLSPSGAGRHGARRVFTDQDARILAWIAEMRGSNLTSADIYTTLRSARQSQWQDLPPLRGMASHQPIAVVPREAVEERIQALQERYRAVLNERDELRTRLEMVERESFATIQELQQRIVELTAQASELRGNLTQYSLGGKQRSVTTLLAFALAIGAGLVILAIVIGFLLSRH